MTRFPDPLLAQRWRERLERFAVSDLTIAEFCRLEGYSQPSFYQWRRKLADSDGPETARFVPVELDSGDLCRPHAGSIQVDLFSGHLFVFFNRRRDYVKILAWDHDGLSIWSKRLERGTYEKLTRTDDGNIEIDSAELVMMLRGVQIEGTQRRKRYSIDPGKAA